MPTKKTKTDVIVIGAGVVGLAVASELSTKNEVVVFEQHSKYGQETSSRNSEVVHSGIYYLKESKKTQWCVRGRELLYSFCTKYNVPFRKCGKHVLATTYEEQHYLAQLKKHNDCIGISSHLVSEEVLKLREPFVRAVEALFLPESGIVNSHDMMAQMETLSISRGTQFVFNHRVNNLEFKNGEWELLWENSRGERGAISCNIVINCAGLGAADISNLVLGIRKYEHRFCRGRYFNLSSKFKEKFKSLAYPVPAKDGLGIHITTDLSGMARLGPDVDWCTGTSYVDIKTLYDCDWDEIKPIFGQAVQRYCPSVQLEDLSPGLVGVRPKLFVEGNAHSDFVCENRNGYVHLLGIESPGLTASLAIAEAVSRLI